MPCGFCGLSGNVACMPYLRTKGKAVSVESSCPYSIKFKYAFAERGSDATPCRNVPILCTLCPTPPGTSRAAPLPAVWRYNMEEHLTVRHSEYASPQNPEGMPLPWNLWKSMEITEERVMGIPSTCIPAPFINFTTETIPTPDVSLKRKASLGTRSRPKRTCTGLTAVATRA